MSWYALYVKTGKEDTLDTYLHYHFSNEDCCCIIPKRVINERKEGHYHKVIKVLFPGYVLINVGMSAEIYYIIKSIPTVYKILNHADQYYTKIDDAEIEPILTLIGDNDVIEYSQILIENSKVRVESGPLKGLDGLIKKVDKRKGRAKVLLDFLGTQKIVELGVEILNPNRYGG